MRTGRLLTLTMIVALFASAAAQSAGFERAARAFAESDFVFNRTRSDIPFVPLAWLDVADYGQSRFMTPSGEPSEISFDQQSLSEATLLPILLDRRDALVIGQWMSWTRFEVPKAQSKDVFSVALPIGWARQSSADWQLAAFVAPLAHTSENDGWYWEYMGGVFARWLHGERLVWLFGLYADISPREEYYIPYAGVTWTIDDHWTVSAVMPWPGILYSPTADWLLRLGITPSDASWSVQVNDQALQSPQLAFGSWNFGLRVERRAWKNIWVGAEVGVAGLRGFSFAGSDWEGPNSDLGTDGYWSLTINFRPSLAASK